MFHQKNYFKYFMRYVSHYNDGMDKSKVSKK